MVASLQAAKASWTSFQLVRFESSLKRRMLFHQLRNLTVVRFGEGRELTERTQ